MLFNSLAFAVFLPVVCLLHWALPNKYRWALLLAASYYFYMSWNAAYIALILLTTAVSYGAALWIERLPARRGRRAVLIGALAVCLGVLFFFKYFNFFAGSVVGLAGAFGLRLHPVTLRVLLPVGISFYTFQTLSYVIDVYRGRIRAERHFGVYATFVSFFPQLVAGPIERTENLLPQLKAERRFDYDQASYGLRLMAWGYFKKLAIADALAVYADKVYSAPGDYTGFALLLATGCFTVQIYCDFSGYSDIAIGAAKLLGIDLMTNFKSPYFSASIREFWSRWHISLSTWFRDYVYIPLGGSRVGKLRHAGNLLVTFLVSGLWHGANWTFVVWGGVHGLAQILENAVFGRREPPARGPLRLLRTGLVFCFCAFAWVFFRANSLADAGYVLTHLFEGIGQPLRYLMDGAEAVDLTRLGAAKLACCLPLLAAYDFFALRTDVPAWVARRPLALRWAIHIAMALLLVVFTAAAGEMAFIYFQF